MEKDPKYENVERLVSALRKKEPVLRDAEQLTDDIMASIQARPRSVPGFLESRPVYIMKRVLAAASVCLFLVFGYEQYVIVDKIGNLERQNAAITQEKNYRTAVRLNEIVAILKSDPEFLRKFESMKKEPTTKSQLVKAALFYEVFLIKGNDTIPKSVKK